MRKIKKTFKSPIKINGLKKLLKKVHSNRSNHLAEISKLNLGKNLVPSLVEKVEIEINSLTGREIITVPHSSLTFLKGILPPFMEASNSSIAEDQYIVLPWSIASAGGREALKHLINKISITTISLTYTIYVESEEARLTGTASTSNQTPTLTTTAAPVTTANIIATPSTSQQSVSSSVIVRPSDERVLTELIEDFSWSDNSFSEDNIEQLSNEIEKLKKEVEEKEKQIVELKRYKTIIDKGWTIELPPTSTSALPFSIINVQPGGHFIGNMANIRTSITATDVKHKATINNAAGNIIFDIDNQKLTLTGNYSNFSTQ